MRQQRRGDNRRDNEPKDEFDHETVDLARVTRVTKGGKQMSFRACVVVGDHNGRVGEGTAKGKDVQAAMEKATRLAKKHVITARRVAGTIPHAVRAKYKASTVLLRPAPPGSGLICGGAVRIVLALAGIESASSKIFNGKNKITVTRATLAALQQLQLPKAAKKS